MTIICSRCCRVLPWLHLPGDKLLCGTSAAEAVQVQEESAHIDIPQR